MKRNSPNTNEPFKRGDVRDDGYVFFAYTKIVKSDGFFKEIWLNPDASDKIRQKDRAQKKAKYKRKTERKSPGFTDLDARCRAAVHQVKRIDDDQKQFGDMTVEEIAEMLMGHQLNADEWDVVASHTGPVSFDLKEAIRISLTA